MIDKPPLFASLARDERQLAAEQHLMAALDLLKTTGSPRSAVYVQHALQLFRTEHVWVAAFMGGARPLA